MSNLDTINVGGIDFDIEDATARPNAASALTITAYKEDDDTASQAYSVIGTPINWKGVLYYTSATIAAGDTLAEGTNLTAATNIGKMLSNIKTYVGSDSKLHFRDATGADSVLPFSGHTISLFELFGSAQHGDNKGDYTNYVTTLHKYNMIIMHTRCDNGRTSSITLNYGNVNYSPNFSNRVTDYWSYGYSIAIFVMDIPANTRIGVRNYFGGAEGTFRTNCYGIAF